MPKISNIVGNADVQDHKGITKLSKSSPFTKGFGDIRFIQEYYTKGWVFKCNRLGVLAGFLILRHCTRQPWTTIYYAGVDPGCRRKGIGVSLLDYVEKTTPHSQIRLGVEEINKEGILFWKANGFEELMQDGVAVTTSNKAGITILQMVKRSDKETRH